jgi:hypothetical protein
MALVLTAKTTTQEEWGPRIPKTEYSPRLGGPPTSGSEYSKGRQNSTNNAKERKIQMPAVAFCVASFYKISKWPCSSLIGIPHHAHHGNFGVTIGDDDLPTG